MENYGKPKKAVGMKFILKFIMLVFFLLFSFFLFSLTKFFIKDFNRGYSTSGTTYVIFVIIAEIVLISLTFVLSAKPNWSLFSFISRSNLVLSPSPL